MPTVRTNVRKAIKSCLLEITTGNGYANTIRAVYDPPISMEKMTQFPCVNLYYDSERMINTHLISNNSLYDIILPVSITAFVHDVNDINTAVDEVLADIQKYFGVNYYISPAGGNRTVFNCIYTGSTLFATDAVKPTACIEINYDVQYSIRVNDPYTMV